MTGICPASVRKRNDRCKLYTFRSVETIAPCPFLRLLYPSDFKYHAHLLQEAGILPPELHVTEPECGAAVEPDQQKVEEEKAHVEVFARDMQR